MSENNPPVSSALEKAISSRERSLKNQMILGGGIVLFGLFCPFFWLRLLSGDTGYETFVYGIHSCVFAGIGLIVLAKGWYDLRTGPV